MTVDYNPIVRNFCRLREVLVHAEGIDRRRVRPATPLADLVPAERQGQFLTHLREAGLPSPELERRLVDYPLCWIVPIVVPLAVLVPLVLKSWLALLTAFRLAFPLVKLAFSVRRDRLVHLPIGPRTVGEMVISLTHFADHPGYPFSHNEVALKVRFVIAEWLGVPVEEVQENTSLADLEG